ncbi:histidine kinase-like ATPase [Apiospora aurea]|uniref:Histidine kinase-like ATPase n=1 Tax=Apiospora aurea TaxID=335848 RepID=A0ABR1QB88_9PEZI
MPIAALPESVAKRLAGHINIASPVNLVKELLDNAIDAQATSVEVIISSNTVDKIEVRDNGVGIYPDDYDSLGRRGHTSKVKCFEELNFRAATSLGFRGEALASVNSVAKVCIITKTSSDPVAASIQLHPKTGGVLTHNPASAPVGTTVIVTGLYNDTPVRERVIVQEAPKSLDGIKELLRSYAIARPPLRLQFKVLKAPRLGWSYAPKSTAGLQEAVLQIHGAAALSQCVEKRFNYDTSASHNDLSQLSFGFEVVAVKPGALAHLLPKGRYFSVDRRPLTATRVGSYDANIEPSKNEVLFSDEEALIQQFERFCTGIYGQLVAKPPQITPTDDVPEVAPSAALDGVGRLDSTTQNCQTASTQPSPDARARGKDDQFHAKDLTVTVSKPATSTQNIRQGATGHSAEGKEHGSEPVRRGNRPSTPAPPGFIAASTLRRGDQQQALSDHPSAPGIEPPVSDRGWAGDMSSDLSECVDRLQKSRIQPRHPLPAKKLRLSGGIVHNDESEIVPVRTLDPWSIARTNTSAPRNDLFGYGEFDQAAGSRPTPEPDILHHYGAAPRDLDMPPNHRFAGADRDEVSSPTVSFRQPYASPQSSPLVSNYQRTSNPQAQNAIPRRQAQPLWTPPSSIHRDQQEWSSSYHSGYQNGPRKASSLSNVSHEQTKLDQFISNHCRPSDIGAHGSSNDPFTSSKGANTLSQNGTSGDNRMLNAGVTQVTGVPRAPQNLVRPHGDSEPRIASFPQISQDQQAAEDHEPIKTSIPPGDPRAYLLRRQKSAAAEANSKAPRRGLKRAKSCLMPLENIPDDETMYNLVFQMPLGIQSLRNSAALAACFDGYIDDDDVGSALDMGATEGHRIEERLDHLLSDWTKQVTGEATCIESQLTAVLKGKGIETA